MGSGNPLTAAPEKLFLNFCGGGMVSTRPGNCVRGKPLVLLLLRLGPCEGDTLQ